ncbi:MAG: hypothetical protein JJU00_14900 [Opitutales bacterium]|nr:hypothetical protein [Opitutales bacterium]
MRGGFFSRVGVALIALGFLALLLGQSPVDQLKRGAERDRAEPSAEDERAEADAPNANEAPAAEEAGEPAAADSAPADAANGAETLAREEPVKVFVIPIHDVISRPNQYILRRGYKEAIDEGIDAVILDIDTPGGYGNVMLDIMERTADFQGLTIAYVNREAISAGAFIAFAANEIWYAPRGIIGAAEAVAAGGQEIPEGMRRKFESYVQAKMRAIADEHPYKADVMRAMMDPNFELVIDGEVLSPEGSLLSLTAEEALREFGDPPTPLFGEGIAASVEELLDQRFGEGNWEKRSFEITWSEELAKFMDMIAPILIGIGFLALFIEFKTPGFGVFGAVGITLIVIVFLSNHVAGLAGNEVLIFFFLGVALVVIEIFLFPGTFVALSAGLALIVGSILWSMADLWPTGDGGVRIEPEAFVDPMIKFSLSLIITSVGIAVLWKFLPESWVLKRIALQTASAQANPVTAGGGTSSSSRLPDVGEEGVVITPLRPNGTVEFNGERFEAGSEYGTLDKGERVIVTGYRNFYLLVDRKPEQ